MPRARACPRDDTPLEARTVEIFGPDVTVDDCPKCHGVFLDKNELARLTGDRALNRHLRDRVGVDVDSELLCPHCGGLMDEETVADVVVDVCLTCYGIWLDNGELDVLGGRDKKATLDDDAKQAEVYDAARVRRPGLTARVNGFFDEIVRRWG